MKSARMRPDGRRRTRRALAVVGLAAAAALAVGATSASAGTWYPTGVIVNQTGSTDNNCPGSVNGLPAGCITVDSTNVVDGSWTVPPSTVAATGGAITSPFQYIAPNLDEGADASINITAPHGSQWTLAQFDDVSWFPGMNNYTSSCSLTTPVSLSALPEYTCQPSWGTTTAPTASFQDSSALFVPFFLNSGIQTAPGGTIGAGAVCQAQLSANQLYTCGPGQLGIPDPANYRYFTVENLGTSPLYVSQADLVDCELPTQGSTCTPGAGIEPGERVSIQAAPTATGTSTYSVAVTSVALVPSNIATGAANTLVDNMIESALDDGSDGALVSKPTITDPTVSGLQVVPRGGAATPKLTYRAPRAGATTVFALALRVGTHWKYLRGLRPLAHGGEGRHTRQRGHFAHRDRKGINTVAVPARIDGKRLTPGRYRITIRSLRGTTIGSYATARFSIPKEAGR